MTKRKQKPREPVLAWCAPGDDPRLWLWPKPSEGDDPCVVIFDPADLIPSRRHLLKGGKK